MRALTTLFKLILWLTLILVITVGIILPATWSYTAANFPNEISLESEADIETYLRQSIESERQSLQIGRPANVREDVRWPKPDFSRLPAKAVALFITGIGCPTYFASPREEGTPWVRRLAASFQGRILDGDGACELILSKDLARRLGMKTDLQVIVAADRIHRHLSKDQLVSYSLHAAWFERGVVGVEKASEIVMQKKLTDLNLAELAELQLAIPPYGYWEEIKHCRNAALLKESRDTLLGQLAQYSLISEEMARTATSQPVRCMSVRR